jgi:hypothetical protein
VATVATIGVVLVAVLAAASYFLARKPSLRPTAHPPAVAGQVRASCQLVPDQTFNAPPGTQATAFTIDRTRACVNGRTPYERTPTGFSRVITNAATGAVTTLDISADLASLRSQDFLLSPKEFAALHAAIGSTASLKCGAADTPSAVAENQARLARIGTRAEPYEARKATTRITWRCSVSQ